MMGKRSAAPFIVWMALFTIVPLAMVVWFAFTDASGNWTFDNILAIGDYAETFLSSIAMGAVATLICLVLAYPLAYSISRSSERVQQTMVMIIMLPMWMNFLLRTYAWMSILENTGLLNRFFDAIGLFDLINGLFGTEIEYFKMINTQGAVVLGMVYNFLPFMILPIYSVIVKLDHRLIEAARDLGADSVTVFRRVTLPLSLPGVLSGITMVFVPAVSTFAISHLLGGGKHLLLGNLIEMQFKGSAYNPYLGSAVALVMMVIVVICMSVMNRFGEGEEQAVML